MVRFWFDETEDTDEPLIELNEYSEDADPAQCSDANKTSIVNNGESLVSGYLYSFKFMYFCPTGCGTTSAEEFDCRAELRWNINNASQFDAIQEDYFYFI
ncbi:hypothetical protein ADUPG1_000660 [Aduncisulcus paluster]|uniref:Uncharacterized protein n=1 Tax=Aduncisulcus paluster TaxID=2918883 RepID=A0ABQ5K7B9_9EUKA|nr:hypothetical protein ADUPG1_000660 [Aduncisulcus paluster]